MGSTVPLWNVVGVRKNLLLKAVVPLHRHLHGDTVLSLGTEKVEHVIERILVLVEIGYEGAQPPFVDELLLFARSFVLEVNLNTRVQKS